MRRLFMAGCGLLLLGFGLSASAQDAPSIHEYDVVIRNGTLYDGSGQPPTQAAVAIAGDRIVATGSLPFARGRIEIDDRSRH